MKCPYCGHEGCRVIDSRLLEEDNVIRRRRECESCKKRFTTYERMELVPMTVLKKAGQSVVFDKNKLLNGMVKACEKRPVSINKLKTIADDIERALFQQDVREVSSSDLGNMVMDALKQIDQVAYVRFASVYREFKDVDSFMRELNQLKAEEVRP